MFLVDMIKNLFKKTEVPVVTETVNTKPVTKVVPIKTTKPRRPKKTDK